MPLRSWTKIMRGPVVIVHHLRSLAVLLLLVLSESYQKNAAAYGVDDIQSLVAGSRRKLMQSDDEGGGSGGDSEGGGGDMSGSGEGCSKDDIVIYQGPTGPLPDGIPTYTVQIMNECMSDDDCSISDIHVSCGWFASARQVNPAVFQRIYYDDCLVNDGNALGPGQSLSFQYANTYPYPMTVSSVSC